MSERHYWASGMRPEAAQKYLLDLCGSESQDYTEREEEVTCERCLAALRAGRGASGVRAAEEAPRTTEAPVALPVDPNGVLDRAVRAAVLKEREEIAHEITVAMVLAYPTMPCSERVVLRQIIAGIRRRP